MVAFDGIENFGLLVKSPTEVGPDLGVTAFDLVVDGFANIMEQSAPPRESTVEPKFIGNGLAQKGNFEAVLDVIFAEDISGVAQADPVSLDHQGTGIGKTRVP